MGNAINHFIFTIVELTGGILSNSLALLSDSFHMLSDVLVSDYQCWLFTLQIVNQQHVLLMVTYVSEILAAFLNGLALSVISIGIFTRHHTYSLS